MAAILAIDVGGSSIKFGRWAHDQLTQLGHYQTPSTINGYYDLLTDQCRQLQQSNQVIGAAISTCGAVDQEAGVIRGDSTIPYIHNFPIRQELADRLGVKVSLENDANCAGLAESRFGAGKDNQSIAMLVLGSGVGGALMENGHVQHGSHLFGGEFGHMILDQKNYQSLSDAISPVRVARRFSEQVGRSVTGKKLFDLAEQGNPEAQQAVTKMLNSLAQATYNIQNILDPDRIIIGGAISANPKLLPLLNQQLERFISHVRVPGLYPTISMAKFHNRANQLGAIVDFCATYHLAMNQI